MYVHIIKGSLSCGENTYPYDQRKLNRIQFKKTLADCALDGTIPEKNLVTPHQMHLEVARWYERLDRNEISTVTRKDLNVELTPVELQRRVWKYGDFTRQNQQINSEYSKTTYDRIQQDPQILVEYHRQFREARKTMSIIPCEEIIRRIKPFSSRWLIGDFGCGEAEIMQEFGEERVYSFDHHNILNKKIIPGDMKSISLKDGDLDIAVFSLSLMGRNWPDYITEAKRCVAKNGLVFIAETTKSLSARLSELRNVIKDQGFEIYSDEQRGDFTFIEARKL